MADVNRRWSRAPRQAAAADLPCARVKVRAEARARGAPREEEDDEGGGLIVEHYRLDPSAALRRSLGWGMLIVTLGSLIVASALLVARLEAGRPLPALGSDAIFRGGEVTADGAPVERPVALELALVAIGLSCITAGGAVAIVGLRRVLSEESYLALRTDGAYYRARGERDLLPWDEVEGVRWDPERRAVVFERHDGRAWVRAERFAGIEGEALAKRAAEVRRKALFGLLRLSRR